MSDKNVILDVVAGESFVILMEWDDSETGERIQFKPTVTWTGDSWDVGDTTLWLLSRINSKGVSVEYLRTTEEIAKMVVGKKAEHTRLLIEG